jgi:hypothetical protein
MRLGRRDFVLGALTGDVTALSGCNVGSDELTVTSETPEASPPDDGTTRRVLHGYSDARGLLCSHAGVRRLHHPATDTDGQSAVLTGSDYARL